MKKLIKLISFVTAILFCTLFCTSCIINPPDNKSNENPAKPESPENQLYNDFYNYPEGYATENGLLTIKNNVASEVLCFTDSVDPKNYIGTVSASSSLKVQLPSSGKFYTIVSVQKSAYEKNPTQATQTSTLVYSSDTQAYKISISPSNLSGAGTWIFNNSTKYWAEISSVDNKETFAVIAPETKRVKIPVELNKAYDYKITYKKELKYDGKIIAIADSSLVSQNDTVYLTEKTSTTFETDLEGTKSLASDIAPSVLFINNSGKSVRVYNGQIQLSNIGDSGDDYVVISGTTAMITGFAAESLFTSMNVRSTAWSGAQYCKDETVMEKGKVYVVTIAPNTEENATSEVVWSVKEKEATEYYEE